MILMVKGPLGNAPYSVLEFPKLHLDRGSTSGLRGLIRNRLGVAKYSVQDVQLNPSGCMLLLGGGVVLKLAKILPDFLAGFVLFVKPLEGVDVTLQVELGKGKALLVGSI